MFLFISDITGTGSSGDGDSRGMWCCVLNFYFFFLIPLLWIIFAIDSDFIISVLFWFFIHHITQDIEVVVVHVQHIIDTVGIVVVDQM